MEENSAKKHLKKSTSFSGKKTSGHRHKFGPEYLDEQTKKTLANYPVVRVCVFVIFNHFWTVTNNKVK